LKIKHLLSMSVGHAKDSIRTIEVTPAGTPWARTFLRIPVEFEPGTRFLYNSGASFMLSAIVKKITGQSAHEYLKPRIYDPLNIVGATWTENPEGINMGASHLRIRTEDIAKFGQLYLQKGEWQGKQLISKEWVAQATTKRIDNGNNDSSWAYGYGYPFWMNPPGGFRADGAFGQFSMVFPELDAVVAITSESASTAVTMQLVWDLLVPEMRGDALPENPEANNQLTKQLGALGYAAPAFATSSPLIEAINGKPFILNDNSLNVQEVTFTFTPETCQFSVKEGGKPLNTITCGINKWVTGDNRKPEARSLFSNLRIDFDSALAASATWQDENTLIITWRCLETTHGDQLTCKFEADHVTIAFQSSMARIQKREDERQPVQGVILNPA